MIGKERIAEYAERGAMGVVITTPALVERLWQADVPAVAVDRKRVPDWDAFASLAVYPRAKLLRLLFDPALRGLPLLKNCPCRERVRIMRHPYQPARTLEDQYAVYANRVQDFAKSLLDWQAWWCAHRDTVEYGAPPLQQEEGAIVAVPVYEPVRFYSPKPRTVADFWGKDAEQWGATPANAQRWWQVW